MIFPRTFLELYLGHRFSFSALEEPNRGEDFLFDFQRSLHRLESGWTQLSEPLTGVCMWHYNLSFGVRVSYNFFFFLPFLGFKKIVPHCDFIIIVIIKADCQQLAKLPVCLQIFGSGKQNWNNTKILKFPLESKISVKFRNSQ